MIFWGMEGGVRSMRETFGQRLRRLRGNRTQLEVAKAVGIDNTVYSRLEADEKKKLDPSVLKRIAEYFDVSIDYLLGRTDPPYVHETHGEYHASSAEQRLIEALKQEPKYMEFLETATEEEMAAFIETIKILVRGRRSQ